MTTTRLAMFNNQELPAWVVSDWKDDTGTQWDMSSGWTFTVTLARTTAPATALAIKSTGITASATAVTVAWSTTDWSGLEAAVNGTDYVVILQAVRTSDSYSTAYRPASPPTLKLKAAPGTSAVSPSSYPITVTAASVTYDNTSTGITATNAQTALTELDADLAAHLADTVDAHDASAISVLDSGNLFAATDAEAALAEIAARLNTQRFLPTGAKSQTMPRTDVGAGGLGALSTGRQSFMSIYLTAGQNITSITLYSGSTAAGTPTNQWFSIYSSAGALQAVTIDGTTGAWATNSAKTLTISGGWTVPTTGLYYVGVMVAATTVPTLAGVTIAFTNIASIAPILCGFDSVNTGLTTPATAPATATISGNGASSFYAYVS